MQRRGRVLPASRPGRGLRRNAGVLRSVPLVVEGAVGLSAMDAETGPIVAAAGLEILTGAAFVVDPSLLARLLFGEGLGPSADVVCRTAGLLPGCLAIGCWPRLTPHAQSAEINARDRASVAAFAERGGAVSDRALQGRSARGAVAPERARLGLSHLSQLRTGVRPAALAGGPGAPSEYGFARESMGQGGLGPPRRRQAVARQRMLTRWSLTVGHKLEGQPSGSPSSSQS